MLFFETSVLCLLFFIICYANTGTDEKNIKSYNSYPDEVQNILRNNPEFLSSIKTVKPSVSFISNLITFTIVLFIFGFFIRENNFGANFFNILFMGEILNAFDLLVIDLLWWRNSERIRFTDSKDKPELYKSPKKHIASFVRGAVVFLLVAFIDGFLLTLL